MTVAIGLVCSDGVIVASDSMATSGPTARPVCKVHAEADLNLVWSASGSVYVIEEVDALLSSMAAVPMTQQICRDPQLPIIRQTFGQAITTKMRECYASALPFGLNQVVNQMHHPFISDFLLLGWSNRTPWFLEVASDGQMNWHTAVRFTAVGSGGPFASVAQALMEHYLEGPSVTVDDGLLLAYRTIATTCAVSSSGVGLPVWLGVVSDKGARILEREEVDEVGTAVDAWKLVEKDAFRSLRTPATDAEPLPGLTDDDSDAVTGSPGAPDSPANVDPG